MSEFKLLMATLAKQISTKNRFLPVSSPGRLAHLVPLVKGGNQAARAMSENNRNINDKVKLIIFLCHSKKDFS